MDESMKYLKILPFLFVLLILFPSCRKKDKSLKIAVAANFAPTLKKVAHEFTQKTGIKVTIIPGSTGKLYSQIKNGAPFDIFLAADNERPKMLVDEKLATGQFTYAVGQLVLWSPSDKIKNLDFLESDFTKLAIPNPKLAPYGQAARETLKELKLWDKINHKIVIGENVSQTLEFARSGNTDAAFVSFSQVKDLPGSLIIIQQKYHSPITQDGCIVKESREAEKFVEFLKKDGWPVILTDGYLELKVVPILKGSHDE